MKGATKKVIVFVVTIAFLWTSYSIIALHSNSSMSTLNDESGNLSPIAFSSSSYSVHLYVNGNGWVKFSANYSFFSFDNDKSQNFTSNGIPSGTVFHLVSSPNAGYSFVNWTGTVDSTNNSIYVTVNQNIQEEAIYLKPSNYSVSFAESGPPSGTEWYLNLSNGQSFSSITSTISFNEPNGTYPYTIATTNKEYSAPGSSFTVNGAPVSESITFLKVTYSVKFTESGLPSGTIWYANFTGQPSSGPITGTSYSLSLTNGSYTYTIATTNKIFSAPGGTFIVNGASVSEPVKFSEVTYSATFTETGLPPSTAWYVNITGQQSSGPITGSFYSFDLTNGTYTYSIQTANKIYEPSAPSGSLTVDGASVSHSVTFSKVAYTVTFTETGLPPEITWYVNLTKGIQSGAITGTSYSFGLANGSYSYTVATADKIYSLSQSSGSFTIDGAPVTETITYSKVTYTVTFTETGLPSGINWYVNLTSFNGTSIKSGPITGSSYSFSLTNGSYSYIIGTTNKIFSAPGGTFIVNGASVSEPVKFSEVTYSATFTESGLPSGTTWYVNLTGSNGTSLRSGSITWSTYSVNLPNSTYTFTIASSDKEYSPSPSSSSITVNGASVSQSVTFSKVTYKATFTETGLLSGTTWYVNLTNGMTSGSITGSSYSFILTNGSYSYTIQTANKIYEPSVSSGSFTVNGAPMTETVTFSKVTYSVTFTESRLPPGTTWYVNGTGLSSYENSPSNITLMLTNGTYTFDITNLSSYYTTTSHFTVTINGKNVTETVHYYHWAYIAGTLSPINATLTINGNAVSISSSGLFNVSVANGTYHIVASENGYTTYYSNFTINNGNVKNLAISLKPNFAPL